LKKDTAIIKKKMNWNLFLLAIPGLIFLLAFYYIPMLGIVIPFKRMDYSLGILKSPWVGFKNFEFLFKSQDAFRITRNTLLLNFMFIIITTLLAVMLALLLYELGRKSVKVYQTALFVPYFVSWVVASYVLYALINPQMGVIPNFLSDLGIQTSNIYNQPSKWPLILMLSYIWKNIGYTTLLFYSTLISIDSTYFEAAAIDGANKLQTTFKISIPHILPVIVLMTLLQIGKIFYSDFGMFYFLTRDSGVLYSTTDVIDTYVYRALRITGEVGMASAAGLYQSVVGFILVLASNFVVKKVNDEYSMF
jgi:putative aldouronate transport system permease protein